MQEDAVLREIEAMYNSSMINIEREIRAFYAKYANSEGITLAEARKRVSQLDVAEFAEKAKEYVKNRDFSKMANDELKLYNLTMKINRLEMLKAQIGVELVALHNDVTGKMREALIRRAEDEYRRQAGILGESVPNVSKSAQAMVKNTVYKADFSESLWSHMDQLRNAIYTQLVTGMIQGRNPNVLAQSIRKAFDVPKYQAERLMRTEMARVQIQVAQDEFKTNGVKRFEFIANHKDGKTCPICKGLDGTVYPVKMLRIGENAPPMHPNCRCAIAPYIDEDAFDKWLDNEITLRKAAGQW